MDEDQSHDLTHEAPSTTTANTKVGTDQNSSSTPSGLKKRSTPVIIADNTHLIVEAKLEKVRQEQQLFEQKKKEAKG